MQGQFRYDGKGGELFSLLFVQILLSTITFGIYSPWAIVKITKYICANLTLDGKKFEFTGEGGEFF